MSIKDKIKKAIKPKKVSYNVRLTPEDWKYVPKLLKKQIAELLAQVKKLEAENKELKEKLKEIEGKKEPKEVKVLKKALKKKASIEREKMLRRIALVPFIVTKDKKGLKLKEPKILYLPYGGGSIVGKNGRYKYFAGWEVEETKNGLGKSVYFLVKTDKGKIARIVPSPSADLSVLTVPYVVQKLISGIYESPVTKDGKLIKTEIGELNPNINAYIESLKQKIAELEKKIEDLESQNYQLAKIKEELTAENLRLKQNLMLANYRADMAQAGYSEQTEKVRRLMQDHALLLTTAMDAQLNMMLERRMNWLLADEMKKLRSQIEQAYGKPLDEAVWESIQNKFIQMVDKAKQFVVPTTTVIKKKEPEKKEK